MTSDRKDFFAALRERPLPVLMLVFMAEIFWLLNQHPELVPVLVAAVERLFTVFAVLWLCTVGAAVAWGLFLMGRIRMLERETDICRLEQGAMRSAFLRLALMTTSPDKVDQIVRQLDVEMLQARAAARAGFVDRKDKPVPGGARYYDPPGDNDG